MPKTREQLLADAQEWRDHAEMADREGSHSLARSCRAEAVALEKQATQTRKD
jgi:hypothetical protein